MYNCGTLRGTDFDDAVVLDTGYKFVKIINYGNITGNCTITDANLLLVYLTGRSEFANSVSMNLYLSPGATARAVNLVRNNTKVTNNGNITIAGATGFALGMYILMWSNATLINNGSYELRSVITIRSSLSKGSVSAGDSVRTGIARAAVSIIASVY